jgi:hypothetical protein
MRQVIGWPVRADESGSDAAHRYMREHGYKPVHHIVVAGMCEEVRYTKRGNRYAIGGMEYDATAETIEFAFGRI